MKPFWNLLLVSGGVALSACTNGNRCDAAHPCWPADACVDGLCEPTSGDPQPGGSGTFCDSGRLVAVDRCEYDTTLCNGVFCTTGCGRGPETGATNPGDCPEGFTDCQQGNHGSTFMCSTNGLQSWQLACSTDADCTGVVLTVTQ